MIGYEEKALCRKIADTFEIASKHLVYPPDFIEKWLMSETAVKIYEKDFNEIAQSPLYIYNSLIKEKRIEMLNEQTVEEYPMVMYWTGYMLTYMGFLCEIAPEHLWKKYDVIRIAEAYETLHTVSIQRAIEEINEEFLRLS